MNSAILRRLVLVVALICLVLAPLPASTVFADGNGAGPTPNQCSQSDGDLQCDLVDATALTTTVSALWLIY
jgi:hypothetical protein